MSAKLDAYPCPIGIDTWCDPECVEVLDRCEFATCRFLGVYRKAEADHKCARLLGLFERHMMSMALPANLIARRWVRFRVYIRDVLRAAELE